MAVVGGVAAAIVVVSSQILPAVTSAVLEQKLVKRVSNAGIEFTVTVADSSKNFGCRGFEPFSCNFLRMNIVAKVFSSTFIIHSVMIDRKCVVFW